MNKQPRDSKGKFASYLTPETIEVGAKYTHSYFGGSEYLGILIQNGESERRGLVIIKDNAFPWVGREVLYPHNSNIKDFWNGFRKI